MIRHYLLTSLPQRLAPTDFMVLGEVRPGATISGGRTAGGGAP